MENNTKSRKKSDPDNVDPSSQQRQTRPKKSARSPHESREYREKRESQRKLRRLSEELLRRELRDVHDTNSYELKDPNKSRSKEGRSKKNSFRDIDGSQERQGNNGHRRRQHPSRGDNGHIECTSALPRTSRHPGTASIVGIRQEVEPEYEEPLKFPTNPNLIASREYFRNWKVKTSDFIWGATVGKGTFGNVKLVTLKDEPMQKLASSGCPELPMLACKMMSKWSICDLGQVHHIRDEIDILCTLDHPYIIGLYGVMQDAKCLYIIMEYMKGGELFNQLALNHQFEFAQLQYYAAQVSIVFEYLHLRKIAYRDLKPENVLIDHKGNVKVADFGFAKVMYQRSWTICGTPEYIAPEIILSKGHGPGVDWWALGVLIYEMATGLPPFVQEGENPLTLYHKITETPVQYPKSMDIRVKDLVRRLLVKDITRRYGCLKGGAGDIKRHKFFSGLDWQRLIDNEYEPPWIPELAPTDAPNKYFEDYPASPEDVPKPITEEQQRLYFDSFEIW